MDLVTILEIVQMLRSEKRKKGGQSMFGIKNLLALVGLLVVGFAGAGWYLGWYKVTEQVDSQGHVQIKADVDVKKIKADGQNLENSIQHGTNPTAPTSMPGMPPAPMPSYTAPPLPPQTLPQQPEPAQYPLPFGLPPAAPPIPMPGQQQTPPLPPPLPGSGGQ
jgi:hypothetical protein